MVPLGHRVCLAPFLTAFPDADIEGRRWVRFGIVYVLFTGGVLRRPSGRHAVAMKDERTVKNYRPESTASHNTRRGASVGPRWEPRVFGRDKAMGGDERVRGAIKETRKTKRSKCR